MDTTNDKADLSQQFAKKSAAKKKEIWKRNNADHKRKIASKCRTNKRRINTRPTYRRDINHEMHSLNGNIFFVLLPDVYDLPEDTLQFIAGRVVRQYVLSFGEMVNEVVCDDAAQAFSLLSTVVGLLDNHLALDPGVYHGVHNRDGWSHYCFLLNVAVNGQWTEAQAAEWNAYMHSYNGNPRTLKMKRTYRNAIKLAPPIVCPTVAVATAEPGECPGEPTIVRFKDDIETPIFHDDSDASCCSVEYVPPAPIPPPVNCRFTEKGDEYSAFRMVRLFNEGKLPPPPPDPAGYRPPPLCAPVTIAPRQRVPFIQDEGELDTSLEDGQDHPDFEGQRCTAAYRLRHYGPPSDHSLAQRRNNLPPPRTVAFRSTLPLLDGEHPAPEMLEKSIKKFFGKKTFVSDLSYGTECFAGDSRLLSMRQSKIEEADYVIGRLRLERSNLPHFVNKFVKLLYGRSYSEPKRKLEQCLHDHISDWLGSGKRKELLFAPHLLSCGLAESRLETSVEVLQQNTRSRLLRIGNFPLQDRLAARVLAGTELLVILCGIHYLNSMMLVGEIHCENRWCSVGSNGLSTYTNQTLRFTPWATDQRKLGYLNQNRRLLLAIATSMIIGLLILGLVISGVLILALFRGMRPSPLTAQIAPPRFEDSPKELPATWITSNFIKNELINARQYCEQFSNAAFTRIGDLASVVNVTASVNVARGLANKTLSQIVSQSSATLHTTLSALDLLAELGRNLSLRLHSRASGIAYHWAAHGRLLVWAFQDGQRVGREWIALGNVTWAGYLELIRNYEPGMNLTKFTQRARVQKLGNVFAALVAKKPNSTVLSSLLPEPKDAKSSHSVLWILLIGGLKLMPLRLWFQIFSLGLTNALILARERLNWWRLRMGFMVLILRLRAVPE